jgi:hypothetical protein
MKNSGLGIHKVVKLVVHNIVDTSAGKLLQPYFVSFSHLSVILSRKNAAALFCEFFPLGLGLV